ncbi:MAG: crossover junction endodeoxyribonuclease RuvC [Phycisphaeraceae bacterium]
MADVWRIIGIDPGLERTGYAVLELPDTPGLAEPRLVEAGVIRLGRTGPGGMAPRLGQLHADLASIIDEFVPPATSATRATLAVEKLYAHYAHPRTAILMAHARGVILLAAQQRGLEVVDLPSTEVKKAVTGHGHASKEQVQRAVASQFNLAEPPEPPDVADAMAVALCHARRLAVARLA